MYIDLAAGIILNAIDDWKDLIRKNAKHQSYNEIRKFFRSEWGKYLCSESGVDAEIILDNLEKLRM